MIIKLYNIPGISPDNEPYFNSDSARIATFNRYLVKSLSTYFYPVQNENRIKLEVTDVPFTLVYNYVSIEMYGKEWYYFVDSFNYINEKVYFLNVTLDVIQTFYFNINIIRFEETRSLTYSGLRDNITKDSTFYPYSINNLDADNGYVIVVQFKEKSSQDIVLTLSPSGKTATNQVDSMKNDVIYDESHDKVISDGLKTFYLLISTHDGDKVCYIGDDGIRRVDSTPVYNTLLQQLQNDPNVVNMYITRAMPYGIEYKTFTLNGASYKGFYLSQYTQYYKNGMVKNGYLYGDTPDIIIDIIPEKCGTLRTPSRELCDSNYCQIYIGEVNDYGIVPIEFLEPNTNYDVYCTLDISSGVRTYTIDSVELNKIKYKQVCSSIETLPLYNDNYNIYLAQNKGTLTTGVALQKTNAWVNLANQVLNQNAAKAFAGAMQGGVAGGVVSGVEATITSGVDMFTTMYGIDKALQVNAENAMYTPDTVKLGNNFSNDFFNGLIDRIILETRVADYDDILSLRQYAGYLSHNVTLNKTLVALLSSYTVVDNKRLIMGDATLSLGGFNAMAYVNSVITRFKSGIRFYTNIDDLGK